MVQYFFRFSSFFSIKVSESDALGLDVAAVGAYHYVELARLEEEIAVEIIVTETLLVQTQNGPSSPHPRQTHCLPDTETTVPSQ